VITATFPFGRNDDQGLKTLYSRNRFPLSKEQIIKNKRKDYSPMPDQKRNNDQNENYLSTLRSHFEKLTDAEQCIVLIISLVYYTMSRTMLLKCMAKLDIKNAKGKRFQTHTLDQVLKPLSDLKLITYPNYPAANKDFADYALQIASESNLLEPIAKMLESMEQSGQILTDKNTDIAARNLRLIRLEFFRKDYKALEEKFSEIIQPDNQKFIIQNDLNKFFYIVSQKPFKGELPDSIKLFYIHKRLIESIIILYPCDKEFESFQSFYNQTKQLPQEYKTTLALHCLYRGQFDAAASLVSQTDRYEDLFLKGWIEYLVGNGDEAIHCFQKAIDNENNFSNNVVNVSILFCLAELLRKDTNDSFDQLKNMEKVVRELDKDSWLLKAFKIFEKATRSRLDPSYKPNFPGLNTIYDYRLDISNDNFPVMIDLFSALGSVWFKGDTYGCENFFDLFNKAVANGYVWFAAELAKIMLHNNMKITADQNKQLLNAISNGTNKGMKRFLYDALNKQVNWKCVIDKLLEISPEQNPSQSKSPKIKKTSSRLVWILTVNNGRCTMKPKEQTLSRNGQWSKGRPVALKRLKEDAITMGFISDQDATICSDIDVRTWFSRGYPQTNYILNSSRAILKLVGHPYVFMEDAPTVPVEIVQKSPELRIEQTESKLIVSIYPVTDGDKDCFIEQKSPTRINLFVFDQNHKKIALYLQQDLDIPISEKKRVHQLIDKLSGMLTIHSDLTDFKGKTTETPVNKTPHIHLQPYGNGLKMNVRFRPFNNQGPYFAPGMGGKTVIATIKNKNKQTTRDLQEEQNIAKALILDCPTLAETDNGRWEWIFDEMDQALNMLLEIEKVKNKPVIEWPEGKPIKLSKPISINSMTFSIKKKTDWFETTGKLYIDEEKTLLFRNLLDLIERVPGNFIPLDDHHFLVLKDQFRRQLEAFNAYCQKTGKGVKIHRLAALSLGDFCDGAKSIKADKHWKNHIKRLEEGLSYQPETPSTFKGELRNYQIEGVQWLMRLAYWQVGACLADDMGLGKTIQALALMLTCAHEGPVLVVAPSSVTFNWLRECNRFAPTLNPILLTGKNRVEIIEKLKPFDLLICSYALLVNEKDHLKKVSFRVVLLDEAQAIKNAETKRYQAAIQLMGKFKMITTGTPIENHLGELWNLFQFINPGLLQTRKTFNERFAGSVEQKGERKKRLALKKLIQPFILRRLKSQVLDELPAKTEIVLEVVQSDEEMALYEAIRQQALEKLSKKSDHPKGHQSIQILAEIMRLRRACCHPRLVLPESQISSSKLNLVGEVLEELLENNHKALIFSQFVAHLTIVREYLDQKGISYQYLDGKTPARERQKRIDAFQAGEGNVFLISLKAGGTGLNLTAADYVLHLDPWWNPAVEDQATDRAHRIGQQRPVTVYKFVTQDTIEQKILALHHNKRNLAQDLLSGSDMTGKMSNEELLRLIET
jgi:SNF2 family DNA or RNA helicase/tetratricopeptide (TPR) repeat protein